MLGGSGSVTHNCSSVLIVDRRCFTCLSPFGRLARRGLPTRTLSQVPFPVHFNTFVLRIQAGMPSAGVFMYASTSYRGYTWLNPNPTHRALPVEMLQGLVPVRPHLASLLFSKRRACPLAPEWFRFLQSTVQSSL